MFNRQPKQKADEQINQRAGAASSATMAAASAIRVTAADTRINFGCQKCVAENRQSDDQQSCDQSAIGNWQSAIFHFSSMRGPSANSFGFSPVAGTCSASSFPNEFRPSISIAGDGRFADSFIS